MVVNASTRDKDLAWISRQATAFGVSVTQRAETAMLAVQGPNARTKVAGLLDERRRDTVLALKPFSAALVGSWFVARTG